MAIGTAGLQTRRMRPLLRASVPALLLPLTLALTACGGDDEPGTTSDRSSAGDGSSPSAEELGELDTAIDDVLASTPLDTIASSIDTVLDNVNGYVIDGDAITLLAEGSSESSSVCTIAGTVLGSFDIPEGTTLEVEFDDGTIACDI